MILQKHIPATEFIKTNGLIVRVFCCFAVFLLQALNGKTQLNRFKFINYTTENGLTDNHVVKIVSDKKGFTWIATHNGLSRFDGSVFTNYTVNDSKNNGLRSSWITDLAVDQTGMLWASTEWGLCYFDEASDTFQYVTKSAEPIILYKAPLLALKNTLWMATESGLLKINPHTKKVTATSLKRISDPQCIGIDAAGNIWIGTRGNGFFVYDTLHDNWQTVFPEALPRNVHLMNFFTDADGIWAATSEGLLKITGLHTAMLYKKGKEGLPQTTVDALTFVTRFSPVTGDSLLLCGTYYKRLALFNKRLCRFTDVSTANESFLYGIPNAIFTAVESRGPVLWIGSEKGLTQLNMETQDFTTTLFTGSTQNLDKRVIKKIASFADATGRLLLLANNPGSMLLYNPKTAKVEKYWMPPAVRKYKTMLQDSAGLWLIHEHGIDLFSLRSGLRAVYTSLARSFFSGASVTDGLWLGTDEGVMHYNIQDKKARYFQCAFRGTDIENRSNQMRFHANGLAPDGKGNLWITSGKYGLFFFDSSSKLFTAYRQPSRAPYETKNRCSSLAFDSAGTLWIGNLAGITRFDTAQKTFINYNQQNGLRSSYVYSIAVDKSTLIFGRGNSGVFCFDPARETFTNFKTPVQMSSDLLEQQISVAGNNRYVGFSGGFSTYNTPHAIAKDSLPVYITRLDVLGRRVPVSGDGMLHLNHYQNVLQMAFACTNYTTASDLTYQYKLDETGGQWTDAGTRRSILFTSLPPGTYTFNVRAAAPDGSTSVRPAVLRFTIHPPFWGMPLFEVTVIMLVAGLIAFAFYSRLQKIKKTEKQKTTFNLQVAEAEMKALRAQINPHFIFNSLNSIQKFIWESKQENASEYLTKFSRLMRMILEHSMHKQITLDQELIMIGLYLELEHRRSSNKYDYVLQVEDSVAAAQTLVPPMLFQPYIENAIWHGMLHKKERGKLTVHMSRCDALLICTIQDNGVGRKAAQELSENRPERATSYGMRITEERIRMITQDGQQGSVLIDDLYTEDSEPCGTRITIRIPVTTFTKI